MRVRFTAPLGTSIGSDPESSPSGLKNTHLDFSDGSVVANKQSESVSNVSGTLNPGRKPHIVWNNSLISGGGESVVAADAYNKQLYASDGSTIKVYPPDYTSGGVSQAVPYISSVGHTTTNLTGAQTGGTRQGYVSYLIIPFNDRGEAGAWRYYGTTFTYNYASKKKDGTWLIYLKPVIDLTMVTVNCSYVEVYRTREGVKGGSKIQFHRAGTAGLDITVDVQDEYFSGLEYLYLDRFEVETSGVTTSITVTDEKTWHSDSADTVLLNHSGGEMPTYEQMIDLGLVNADVVSAPTSSMNYAINVWDSPVSGNFDCDSASNSFSAPSGFGARTMMEHQGVMLYGDVTWRTKLPAVAVFDPGEDTVKFQYEYRIYNATVYGPVLTMQNVGRALIAWQGEAALLMYSSTNNLLRRLVPNAQGMYIHNATEDDVFTDASTLAQVEMPVRSFWTYVSGVTYSGTVSNGLKAVTSTVDEDNVIFLSAQYRPLEVTFDQFYLPDNSACRALSPARIEESDSLSDYHGYAFTDRSVFMWTRSNRDVQIRYVEQTFGLKYNPFNQGMVVPIKGGVAFVGSNDNVYVMSGNEIAEIDAGLSKWSAVFDIAYNAYEQQIYILTDAGIWVYDTRVYKGFYKQIDKGSNPAHSQSISYIGGTVEDISFNHVLYHNETTAEDLLLEYKSSTETDTSVTTQPLRVGAQVRISELRVDHDRGPNVRQFNIADGGTTVSLVGTGDSVFNIEDVGTCIKLQGAGVGGVTLNAVITSYTSGSQVEIGTAASTAVTGSGKQALWPVVNVVHDFRSPEEYQNTFFAYPWARRFPKGYGIEHQLEIKNFQKLRELHIDFRPE